jgi:hypothetical protein
MQLHYGVHNFISFDTGEDFLKLVIVDAFIFCYTKTIKLVRLLVHMKTINLKVFYSI